MSEHRASLKWRQGDKGFALKTFCRNHTVRFASGAELPASAAPDWGGDPARVDPEAMLVASLQSCHMLTFLALCARDGLNVESYEDEAVGLLERNADRKFAVTRITLHPRATFAAGTTVTPAQLQDLHHRAHEACFIANSIKCLVEVRS